MTQINNLKYNSEACHKCCCILTKKFNLNLIMKKHSDKPKWRDILKRLIL